MDSAELNFILKIRDEATAVIKAHAGAIRELGAAHGGVKESAKEAETGLSALVNKSKEAAEAFGAMWTASELNEKTLGAFAEMEVAMLRLQQASGATAAGIREMQEGIESIAGRSLNQTAEQIAGVEKAAAQLGIKGGEAIEAFASTTSKLATVTGMTVDSISSGMGRILTATGETQEGAKKFGDVFSALADKTRGGGEALVATAQQITMMTGGMKVSSENILSIASAVEGLGLRSRQAGMAVGQAFSRMSAIAEQGGVQLQTLALATGSTADEFKNLVKEDPSKAFTALLGAIQKVQATGAPVTDFLKQFGLGGKQIETALGAAAKQMGAFEEKAKAAHDAAAGGTDLDEKWQKYMETLTAGFHEIASQAKAFGVALGDALEPLAGPLFKTVGEDLEGLNKVFGSLPDPIKTAFAAIIVGLPILVAAGLAWKFLTEVVLTCLGTFRSMSGPLGAMVKTLQLFKGAATEAGVAMEEVAILTGGAGNAFAASAVEVETAAVAMKAAGASAVVAGETMVLAGEAGLAGGAAMAGGLAAVEAGAVAAKVSVLSLSSALMGLLKVGMVIEGGKFLGELAGNFINKNMPTLANKVADWRDSSAIGGAMKSAGHMLGAHTPQEIEQEKREKAAKEKHGEDGHADGHEETHSKAALATGATGADLQAIAVAEDLLKSLDSVVKKKEEYKKQLAAIDALEKVPESIRAQLGLDNTELLVLKNIMKVREDALDPMNKMREGLDQQLATARAITKQETDQLAVDKAIADAKKANPRFNDAEEAEVRSRMAAINSANIKKTFDDQIRGTRESIQMSGALTATKKSRLEIELKIADAQKKQGYTPEQLASLKQALTLEQQIKDSVEQMDALNPQAKALRGYDEQNKRLQGRLDRGEITPGEKEREQTKLDADTLGARDPIGKIVDDQKTEMAQLKVIGEYKDAQLKTMGQIDALEKSGLDVTQKTKDALLEYNKAVEDQKQAQSSGFEGWANKIGDMKSQLQSLESSFADGLSTAITGALSGKKGNFSALAQNIGGQMIKLGVDQVLKQGIQASGVGNLFGLGSGEAAAKAKVASDALKAAGDKQVSGATANADAMAKQITTASMAVTATTVNINGAVADAAPGMPGGDQAGLPGTGGASMPGGAGTSTPQQVDIASVGGTALTTPTIPFSAPGQIAAGAAAMDKVGAGAGFGIGSIGDNGLGRGSVNWDLSGGQGPAMKGLGEAGIPYLGGNISSRKTIELNPPAANLNIPATPAVAQQELAQQQLTNPFQKGVPSLGANPGMGGFGVEAFRKLPSGTGGLDASSQDAFITSAFKQAQGMGEGDAQARLTAAQASLESRDGASGLTKEANNYFGMKAGSDWKGDTVSKMTREVEDGKDVTRSAQFKKYANADESFKDHAAFVNRKYPEVAKATDLKGAAEGLRTGQPGGYATDPNYVSLIQQRAKHIQDDPKAAGQGASPADKVQIEQAKKQAEQGNKAMLDVQKQGHNQQIDAAHKAQTDSLQAQTRAGMQSTQAVRQSAQQQVQTVQASGQQTTAAFQQAGTGIQTAGTDAQTAGPEFQQAGQQIQQAGQQAQSGGGDMGGFGQSIAGLAGPLSQGKAGMGSFAQAALGMVSKMLSGMGGGGGGGGIGGMLGGLFGGMHSGGLVGSSSMYSTSHFVSPAVFANAQRFHSGLMNDEYPAILQRGERVLTANDNSRNTALLAGMSDHMQQMQRGNAASQGGNGGPRSQTMHMTITTPDASSFRKSQPQIMSEAHSKMQRAGSKSA